MNLMPSTVNSYINDYLITHFLKENAHLLFGKVLDIGCGNMRYKKIVLSNDLSTDYIGLDLEAGKFTYSVKADLYWDGTRIPLDDSSVDCALLCEVLEHCSDPYLVLNEAHRVMKKGGVLLLSTPFLYQIHGSPFDYYRHTPFKLAEWCSQAGFSKSEFFATGSYDTSLAQMLSIWIQHRPMNSILRRILKRLLVPFIIITLRIEKSRKRRPILEHDIMPGIVGIVYK